MDPIESGNVIFKNIADQFGNEKITTHTGIQEFFTKLIEETDGWVILDFLDTANWDKIESFEFNDEEGFLTLIWHDYRTTSETEDEREMRQMVFPASLYAVGIGVNSVVPIIGEQSAIFLLNGYSITEKDIKKLYKAGCSEFKIYNNSFFEKRIVRKVSDTWEVIHVHCTPIFSLAIIPKRSGFSSFDSKRILYQYNIQKSIKRLSEIIEALESINAADHDLICEKVNTARRILESVLKIECCYREVEIKADYSKILLGPLLNYVKGYKDEDFKPVLGKMAELLNEFSHDTGKKIELDKAKVACIFVMAYLKSFQLEIK
jgi:hypothetical protein